MDKAQFSIDDYMKKLNVIIVYYNFSKYKRRKQLTLEFIERFLKYNKINLYVVELILENDDFEITQSSNKNHLQLKTKHCLWFKENLINIAVNKLLDKNWENFAWIDSDITYLDDGWVNEALRKLDNYEIIQLFANVFQLDINNDIISSTYGILNRYINKYDMPGYPGYAWAISRNGYNKIEKIPDMFIIGGGDNKLAHGILKIDYFISKCETHNINFDENFKKYIIDIQNKMSTLSFSYIEYDIHHFYHGSIKNRQYIIIAPT
jgi:hypothetical protein